MAFVQKCSGELTVKEALANATLVCGQASNKRQHLTTERNLIAKGVLAPV